MKNGFPIRWKDGVRRRFRRKLKTAELRRRRQILRAPRKRRWQSTHVLELLRAKMRGKICGRWDLDRRTYIIPLPRDFSLISNPDESLDVIYTLASVTRNRKVKRLLFDHAHCEEMDMGASVILDVVALKVRDERRANNAPCKVVGRFPTNPKMKERLICTGLYRSLGLHVPERMLKQYEMFPLYTGRKPQGDQSKGGSNQVEAAERLAEHVSTCLSAADYALSAEGQQLIAQWAGEIIDNAEDHSGQNEWYVIAHMDKSVQGIEGECHLAIFSFGQSIYESISDPTTPDSTKDAFRSLALKHRQRKFFQLGDRYAEPDLWTMYALQEQVSRFNGQHGFVDRGTGTVSMIEAFQGFGGTHYEDKKPFMNLISGSSRILFDGRYQLESKTNELGEIHKIIAFNNSGDLEERPDESCVHSLQGFFPGTVINFKFFIDRVFLESKNP